MSILDRKILDHNKSLDDVEVTVRKDFLDKLDIDVTHNDVDVCTNILGALLCK